MMYYLFAIADNISIVSKMVAAFVVIAIAPCLVIHYIDTSDDSFSKPLKLLVPLLIVFSALAVFFPSQKQLAFIISAPYIVENQDIKEAGKNVAEIAKLGTEYLKDVLKETNK